MFNRFEAVTISLPAFALYAVASVVSVPLAFLSGTFDALSVTLISLCITAIAGCVAWFTQLARHALNPTGPIAAAVFLTQLALIGVCRGVAFFAFTDWFDLDQPTSLMFRVINSLVMTFIWLGLACAVVSGHRAYIRQYRKLVNQAVFTEVERTSGGFVPNSIDIDRFENVVALKANLAKIYEQVSQAGMDQAALEAAASSVRHEIEATVRPLSHRLWFNATDGTPQVRPTGLIVDALGRLQFSIARVLFICILPTFVGGLAFLPLTVNIATVVISTATLALLLFAYRGFTRRSARPHPFWNAVFILSSGILTFAVTEQLLVAVLGTQAAAPFAAMAWIIPGAVAIVVWADSALHLVQADRKTISHSLRPERSQGIEAAALRDSERLASYLHNSLQSELTGLAFQLEHSARDPNVVSSRQSLEQLAALIRRSMSEDFAHFSELPSERITRVVTAWSGIVDIEVFIDAAISHEDARLALAVQIVEECITNAVRHAGATFIRARVSLVGADMQVEFASNVQTVPTKGNGMGWQWLERYSLNQTHISDGDSGSTLTVVL